jgi:hypothetical protein
MSTYREPTPYRSDFWSCDAACIPLKEAIFLRRQAAALEGDTRRLIRSLMRQEALAAVQAARRQHRRRFG